MNTGDQAEMEVGPQGAGDLPCDYVKELATILKAAGLAERADGNIPEVLAHLMREIIATRNQLQATLDAIPDLLFELGLDGSYYSVSCTRPELLAAPTGELLGRKVPEVLPPAASAVVMAALQEALDGAVSTGRQFELDVPQGRRWFELSVSRKTTPHEDQPRFIVLSRDITERKVMQEELRARLAESERAQAELNAAHHQLLQSEKLASIGQLAAGVAHEINNPVGYVNSNIGTLENYLNDIFLLLDACEEAVDALPDANPLRQRVRQLYERMDLPFLRQDMAALIGETKEGVTRVRQIVQDLKDFSRTDQVEWQFADLHAGLEKTINIVWNELKYKAEVMREYGELPEIECIPAQLNQVFMNLLVNAAQAIEGRGTIRISTGCRGEEAWVEVEDDGKGISPEHLGRIFDPFFTTKPVGKGTGLGLALSYNIVKAHGGQISVQSRPGAGSRFRVILPVTRQAAPAAERGDG